MIYRILTVVLILILCSSPTTQNGSAIVEAIRQDYYKLSKNKLALMIPIYYDKLDENVVAAAYYQSEDLFIGRYIVINTEYLSTGWSFRGTLLHELEHAVGNQLYHLDGYLWLNGNWCPKSLMNTYRWEESDYINCYKTNQKLYEKALIKKVTIDKLINK